MDCPKCGAEYNGVLCEYCGHSNSPQPQHVTIIHNHYDTDGPGPQAQPNYQYQQPFYGPINQQFSAKSRMVAIILTLMVCVGFGGLNRFYVGKIGTGVLYLLTGGLCGIGALVDLIMLICGTFTDANGRPLHK